MAKEFNQLITYKKGELAERIVDRLILERGDYIPYEPIIKTAHAFDRMLVSRSGAKMMMMDVKALSARYTKGKWAGKGYPDTGISIAHRNVYLEFTDKHQVELLLMFVDCEMGEVYGNTISNLEQSVTIEHNGKTLTYPVIQSNFSAVGGFIVYYPIASMQRGLYYLTESEIAQLRGASNYDYKQDISHKPGYQEWLEEQS